MSEFTTNHKGVPARVGPQARQHDDINVGLESGVARADNVDDDSESEGTLCATLFRVLESIKNHLLQQLKELCAADELGQCLAAKSEDPAEVSV
jgi:hypothetical protein